MQRQQVNVRMSEDGIKRLDTIARETRSTRAEVIRVVLGFALKDSNLVDAVYNNLDASI